ncbi:hypothetical protein [Spiroplasma clarkii]|uniref:hypothetical protein n=1 Tax=Spiroplasma clarkii TaxID=2139 RepID=UPI0011BAAA1F|nr:hypothetical protein [Spiroplasma clarkii]
MQQTNYTTSVDTVEVLVICIGAGSSAMLAETINKAFSDGQVKVDAKACSSGNYSEFIENTNLVIISPQARSIQKSIDDYAKGKQNMIVFQTKGPEFLEMISNKKLLKIK